MSTRLRSTSGVPSNDRLMGHAQLHAKSAKIAAKIVPFTRTGNQDTIFPLMKNKNGTPKNARLVGYAPVSKGEQNLDLQLDALTNVACDRQLMFVDKVSGAKSKRPGLDCLHGEINEW